MNLEFISPALDLLPNISHVYLTAVESQTAKIENNLRELMLPINFHSQEQNF